MGFGWLLCGYFATFMMRWHAYGYVAVLIGGLIMWTAATKLKDYCPSFALTEICSIALMVLSCYDVLQLMAKTFAWEFLMNTTVSTVVDAAQAVADLGFQFCMLYAIWQLSKEVGVSKIYGKVSYYMTLFGVCTVLQIVLWIFPELVSWQSGLLMKMLFLLTVIGYLLCKCYQYICPEGEEYGKERKPSRFAFINRMREKAWARDEAMFQQAQDIVQKSAEKRQEKQARRKNKKKKK